MRVCSVNCLREHARLHASLRVCLLVCAYTFARESNSKFHKTVHTLFRFDLYVYVFPRRVHTWTHVFTRIVHTLVHAFTS